MPGFWAVLVARASAGQRGYPHRGNRRQLTYRREAADLPRLQHNGQSQNRTDAIDRQELSKTRSDSHPLPHHLLESGNLLRASFVLMGYTEELSCQELNNRISEVAEDAARDAAEAEAREAATSNVKDVLKQTAKDSAKAVAKEQAKEHSKEVARDTAPQVVHEEGKNAGTIVEGRLPLASRRIRTRKAAPVRKARPDNSRVVPEHAMRAARHMGDQRFIWHSLSSHRRVVVLKPAPPAAK
ncbi:MAG: hypothetical protein ACREX4_11605 [Gammaproteobacteria bacterium]